MFFYGIFQTTCKRLFFEFHIIVFIFITKFQFQFILIELYVVNFSLFSALLIVSSLSSKSCCICYFVAYRFNAPDTRIFFDFFQQTQFLKLI